MRRENSLGLCFLNKGIEVKTVHHRPWVSHLCHSVWHVIIGAPTKHKNYLRTTMALKRRSKDCAILRRKYRSKSLATKEKQTNETSTKFETLGLQRPPSRK